MATKKNIFKNSCNNAITSDKSNSNIEKHVLVKWLLEKTFSVVGINNVKKKNFNDVIQLDHQYLVKYKNEWFDAIIKKIGTREECFTLLNCITGEKSIKSTSGSTTTDSNNKKTQDNAFLIEIKNLKNDLGLALKNIKDNEKSLKEKDQIINQLKVEIDCLKNKIESINLLYSPEDKKKFLEASKHFIGIFGCPNDLNDIYFSIESDEKCSILSKKYPSIMVSIYFKSEMDALAKIETVSYSKIIRRIIQVLIPNEEEWVKDNFQQFKINHKTELYATFDYVKSVRNFKISEFNNVIRQIRIDTKRKLEKLSKNGCNAVDDDDVLESNNPVDNDNEQDNNNINVIDNDENRLDNESFNQLI